MIGEYDASGNEIKTYGYDPNSTWTTNPLFQKIWANYYWYQNDHLGTPQKMTDSSGGIVWAATYSAFGEATIETQIVRNNLRFPGQYYDQETGLHYNWNRYYDPKTGRYLTPDPIGLQGGINLFLYILANPINLADPLGLYGNETHKDLTKEIALDKGLNACGAEKVAAADQDVDDKPATTPDEWTTRESSVRKRALWHFPTAQRVAEVKKNALDSCKLDDLGKALHVLQDSFSHRGYGPKYGHVRKGHRPDNPASDWPKYCDMTAATENFIEEFRKKCPDADKCCAER